MGEFDAINSKQLNDSKRHLRMALAQLDFAASYDSTRGYHTLEFYGENMLRDGNANLLIAQQYLTALLQDADIGGADAP